MLIAQLSDTHIKDGHDEPTERLRAAVAHLLRLPAPPAVVIVSGDCTDTGSASEYAAFREALRPLTMPVYAIPGNHDQRPGLRRVMGEQGRQALPELVQYVVDDAGPLRLIGLDTLLPGHDSGLLDVPRLDWLAERLAEAPARPTLIFMHHPPFPTGLYAYEQMGLAGAAAFEALVARHPQVQRVVAGHVHTGITRRFAGTIAQTCPSTLHQLLPDAREKQRLHVVMEPPAVLLHVWDDAAGLLSYTSTIGAHGPVVEVYDGAEWLMPPRPVRE
ncbi:phosphodiesterase [Hymenobacter edaphi]|uniref:Phosphodiesterase n=1 Tax=Hymenobacter edaphi TaxID=2211146 RepID=A0A328BLN1_9BACT|nr:phosphodiesterase [Hymenobacter edaphi]RAK66886.1 phosphodiesterase [Hymenobacter edaphi]